MNKIIRLIVSLLIYSIVCSGPTQGQSPLIPPDTLLKKKLETMRLKDQTLRLILPMVEEKFGKSTDETRYFWTLIHEQDSINQSAICNIIDQEGWVGINRVGYFANQSIWLIIQHAPIQIQEKYMPKLEESVAKGESEGWYLAFLEDRILMRNGKMQKYGSQAKHDQETGKYHIFPIIDPDKVNDRRQRIGLEPIEEYAKKNGYIYNTQKLLPVK